MKINSDNRWEEIINLKDRHTCRRMIRIMEYLNNNIMNPIAEEWEMEIDYDGKVDLTVWMYDEDDINDEFINYEISWQFKNLIEHDCFDIWTNEDIDVKVNVNLKLKTGI